MPDDDQRPGVDHAATAANVHSAGFATNPLLGGVIMAIVPGLVALVRRLRRR